MKSIFLVNPISGRGHLDAYARLYSRALIELGYRVILIAETDGGATDYLARNSVTRRDLFSFISFAEASKAGAIQEYPRAQMSSAQRAWVVWQDERLAGVLRRLVVLPRRALRALVPEAVRLSWNELKRKIYSKVSHLGAIGLLKNFLLPDFGRIPFGSMIPHVRNAASISAATRPDMIFFLYLDLMAEAAANVAVLDRDAVPWSGILFHPKLARLSQAEIEGYFGSRNARGGIFLVPPAIDIYAKVAPHLKFVLAPDVADLETTLELPPVAEQIRQRAAGRTIILQIGTITPHKGIMTLLDVISQADPRRFFFALIGKVYWQSFGADEKRLRNFYAQMPENVLAHDDYMSEEREYNSLIAACDVVYAVYDGFNSSSNSLTKAAGLRRPILVAKNSLMGERVVGSEIGSVAANDDVNEILAALESLASRPVDSFGFDRYLDQHSLDELKVVLTEGLTFWLAKPTASNN
jgi:glycosyltransferase involved in cell wall biosynthesis